MELGLRREDGYRGFGVAANNRDEDDRVSGFGVTLMTKKLLVATTPILVSVAGIPVHVDAGGRIPVGIDDSQRDVMIAVGQAKEIDPPTPKPAAVKTKEDNK